MNLRAHPTSSRGFTLIEVMLAATVLLAGVIGMIQMLGSGAEMLDVSRKQTIATQVLHGEIERVRLKDWAEIDSTTFNTPGFGYVDPSTGSQVRWISGNGAMPDNVFKVSRTVEPFESRTDFKKVSYTISWVGNNGRSYTRTTSTFVGKNGLYVAYQR